MNTASGLSASEALPIGSRHRLVWRVEAWWTNPVALFALLVLPAVLLPFLVDKGTFREAWNVVKFLDARFAYIAIASLMGLALGVGPALFPRHRREQMPLRVDQVEFLVDKGRLLLSLTLFGYLSWLLIGLARGADFTSVLADMAAGQSTDFASIKSSLSPTAGITSFMQVGPVAAAVYVIRAKLRLKHARRWLAVLLTLALFRAFVYAERLALLEIGLAILFAHACLRAERGDGASRRPRQGGRRILARVAPAFAPVGMVALFGVTEATRSWANHYSRAGVDFWDFILIRLGGYYATAVNNSAMLDRYFPSEHIPLYSVAWLWNMPGVNSLIPYSITGATDPGVNWIPFLRVYANPEYNNVGMLSVVWDVGPVAAPIVFFSFGLLIAFTYLRARSGSAIATVTYASLAVALMELPRYFYIGQGRAFPIVLTCLLLALAFNAQQGSPKRRSLISTSHE